MKAARDTVSGQVAQGAAKTSWGCDSQGSFYCCLVAKSCSPPGSSVRGISPGKNAGVGCHFLLQRIFSSQDRTHVSCIGGWILYH